MRKTGFLLICLATILSACGGGERAASNAMSANSGTSYEPAVANTTVALSEYKANSNASANTVSADARSPVAKIRHLSVGQQVSLIKAEQVSDSEYNIDRKIVRNAELDLESESPEQAQQRITSIAEMNGGFVVDSQQSMSNIRAANRD